MKKTSVIIAEDDDIMREVLFDELTEKGYDVRSAANGSEAWQLFQRQTCEILMTDLEMPKMTGQELLEKVKRHSPTTLAIVLTGYGSLDSARKLIDIGCNEYLVKPIKDISEIDKMLKRLLEQNRHLIRESVCKGVDMAKSRLLHEITFNFIEPTYALLNSIDTLISHIKAGNAAQAIPMAENIKRLIKDMTTAMEKGTEFSDVVEGIRR